MGAQKSYAEVTGVNENVGKEKKKVNQSSREGMIVHFRFLADSKMAPRW